MTYKLFIDDERMPPRDGEDWVICRSMGHAKECVAQNGWPRFISFDHDLGDGCPTGMDISKWLIEEDLDNGTMPPDFEFYVHSQNPVGAENIREILRSYMRVKSERSG